MLSALSPRSGGGSRPSRLSNTAGWIARSNAIPATGPLVQHTRAPKRVEPLESRDQMILGVIGLDQLDAASARRDVASRSEKLKLPDPPHRHLGVTRVVPARPPLLFAVLAGRRGLCRAWDIEAFVLQRKPDNRLGLRGAAGSASCGPLRYVHRRHCLASGPLPGRRSGRSVHAFLFAKQSAASCATSNSTTVSCLAGPAIRRRGCHRDAQHGHQPDGLHRGTCGTSARAETGRAAA